MSVDSKPTMTEAEKALCAELAAMTETIRAATARLDQSFDEWKRAKSRSR